MDEALKNLVRERAADRCEYCQIHQDQDCFYTFPVDHIIARQHCGATESGNLCLSCYRCNSHKGPNIASIDHAAGELVALFDPRNDVWDDHFQWDGAILRGRTPTGRATAEILAINHPDFVLLRETLIEEGTFPP